MESEQRFDAPTAGQYPVTGYPRQWTPADEYRARKASRRPGSKPLLRTNLQPNGEPVQDDVSAELNQQAIETLEAREQARVEEAAGLLRRLGGDFPVTRAHIELGLVPRPQLPQDHGFGVVGPPPGPGYNIDRPMANYHNLSTLSGLHRLPIPHGQAAPADTDALPGAPVSTGRAYPLYTNTVRAVRSPVNPPPLAPVSGFTHGVSRSPRPPPRPVQQGGRSGSLLQHLRAGEPNDSPLRQVMNAAGAPPGAGTANHTANHTANYTATFLTEIHAADHAVNHEANHSARAVPAPQNGPLAWRGLPNGLPNGLPQGISPFYRGNRMLPNNMSADIENIENCSLWLTNLPRDCNEKMLLGAVHACGKVLQTVINPPEDDRHTGSAAKLIFFHHEEAARLLQRSREGLLRVGDRQPKVTHNRTRVRSKPASKESRVLQITGPREIVNFSYLTQLFTSVCTYQLETFEDRGPVGDGPDSRHEMIWRFGSFRCQAHWCFRELHDRRRRHKPSYDEQHHGHHAGQTNMGRLWNDVEIHYGVDPCDVNPGA